MAGYRDGDPENHYADLNLFAAIQALCESSLMTTQRGKVTASQISRICQHEQQMQLRAYDRAKDTRND